MKKHLLILIALVLATMPKAWSQEQAKDTQNIRIYQDQRLDELVQKQIKINETNSNLEGYRIQIYSDSGNNSKTRAQAAMDDFLSKHPGVRAYLVFKSPNYKVKVGDFRTRLDALKYLSEISADYQNAFIISDQINLPQVEP
jgi:phage-related protein